MNRHVPYFGRLIAGMGVLCGAVGWGVVPAGAQELAVPVSIVEPAGVARQAFPAAGGIPFKAGQVRDVGELILTDAAGKIVPAQFTRLAGYDDGSVQWALVDVVLTKLAANGTQNYTIRKGKPAGQLPQTLKIEESDAKVVVDTGVATFTVSKADFRLFDDVRVNGRQIVAGGSVDLLNCELGEEMGTPEGNKERKIVAPAKNGKVIACRAGKPNRVKWEYRGPIRATLRIDGEYLGEGAASAAPLSYSTRITAWAGSPAVRVEHSIRNSNPAGGTDAYIRRAALSLKLACQADPQTHPAPDSIFVATPPPPPPPEAIEAPPVLDAQLAAVSTNQPPKKKKKGNPGDFSAKPCDDWASGGDGTVGVMILTRHTGGVYRGPGTYLRKGFDCGWSFSWPGLYSQSVKGGEAFAELVSKGPESKNRQGELGFTQDGTFALADRAHKDTEVWFDFYAGARDTAANAARAAACRSKLLIVAPGEWYSETEALGSGHFGTLTDEVATYKLWGWKGADDASRYPRLAHQPFAYVPKEWVHDVTEDDAVEGYLLQFLRTGERGFFDWGEAYAGLYRCQAIFRSDWGAVWGTPEAPAGRVNQGMGFGWYGPHYYDWADSRMHYCHQYGRGIFDYYCLTGDTDALEAGLNLAAEMSAGFDRSKPGGPVSLGRSFGRSFNTVLRAYQLTRDPQYKRVADQYGDWIVKGSNWDPEKKIYLQQVSSMGFPYFEWDWVKQRTNNTVYIVPPRLLQYIAENKLDCKWVKEGAMATKDDQTWQVFGLTQVFELSECHQAMERYARIMNSQPMKDRLVEFTRGIITQYWSEKCQFMRDSGYVNWPDNHRTRDRWEFTESHDACPANPGGIHSGYSTRYVADMCARAYSFSADRYFLEWSKKCWNRGNKRMYQQDRQIAAEDEVGPFASIRGAHSDAVLECAARLTYEWPRAGQK